MKNKNLGKNIFGRSRNVPLPLREGLGEGFFHKPGVHKYGTGPSLSLPARGRGLLLLLRQHFARNLQIACIPLLLAACGDIYPPTPKPDYTIQVQPTPGGGMAAVPPGCPSWSAATVDPYDNQPLPQYGCATARNLALMVDRPQDLVQGRDIGPANAVTTVGAMRRYNANQTRGFVYPSGTADASVDVTTSSSPSSALSGEAAGGSGGGAAAAPAAPSTP